MGALIFRDRPRNGKRRGPILLVQRGGKPLKGYWSLPGGLLETGETLETAVKREILEETGLIVRPVEQFGVFERIMRDPQGQTEYHYLLIDYVCEIEGGTMQAGDDVARVEWVLRRNLGNYLMTEGTQAVIEKAYGGKTVNQEPSGNKR